MEPLFKILPKPRYGTDPETGRLNVHPDFWKDPDGRAVMTGVSDNETRHRAAVAQERAAKMERAVRLLTEDDPFKATAMDALALADDPDADTVTKGLSYTTTGAMAVLKAAEQIGMGKTTLYKGAKPGTYAEAPRPGYNLGVRGATAGYVAEKTDKPVAEVLREHGTKGKDLAAAGRRRAAQADAQRTAAAKKTRPWQSERAEMEDKSAGEGSFPAMLSTTQGKPSTSRSSKAKSPSAELVQTAQHVLDQLANGQSLGEAWKSVPKELSKKAVDQLTGRRATDFGTRDISNAHAATMTLNRVLGSTGVDLEPGVYDALASIPGMHKLKARVLARPDVPQSAYDAFLMAEEPSMLALNEIAKKPDLSESQIELLLRQGDPFVRGMVASRDDLSEAGVRWLWQNDPSGLVRKNIASRKELPIDIVQQALDDKEVLSDPYVQLRLVGDKRVPPTLAASILTGQTGVTGASASLPNSHPEARLVFSRAASRDDINLTDVLHRLHDGVAALRGLEPAQAAEQADRIAVAAVNLAPVLARQVELAETDATSQGARRNAGARARRAGLLQKTDMGPGESPAEAYYLLHRVAKELDTHVDGKLVPHNPAADLPDYDSMLDGPGSIGEANFYYEPLIRNAFSSYLSYFRSRRIVRENVRNAPGGIEMRNAYQRELRRAHRQGLDHVPMVLQRGVPFSRGEKDIMGRGLSSPSMYAIDAFRDSSVGSGFRNLPYDRGMPYLIYQMKPERFKLGRANLTYAIGADGGTGESGNLLTLREQLDAYRRENGEWPSMHDIRHMVSHRLRGRLDEIIAQDDTPAGVQYRKQLETGPGERDLRRAFDDYVSDSWYNKTGLFGDTFDREQRLDNFDHARRAHQGRRHGAPEFFTRSSKGDHPILPIEGQKFMHRMMRAHPNTYAEIKSLDAFPGDRISDAVGQVLFVWPDKVSLSALSSGDKGRLDALKTRLDDLGIMYRDISEGDEMIDAQRTSPFQMDAKGGDVDKDGEEGGADRFALSRNFLATDKVPGSLFGIPIAANEGSWTDRDIAFFRKHPEAGGYYDMGDGEETSPEEPPMQAAEGAGDAEPFILNGNLKTEGRPRYLFRDDDGKVKAYGTQLSTVRQDTDGTWVAIPTIIDGREPLSDDAAFEHYKRTGEFFHRGKTWEEAKAGADAAHERSQRQDIAWWNNYIADHLYDGTLSTTDEDMQRTVNDPGFLRWAAGQEEGAYKRTPGESDATLRVERRRRAILDGKIEPNAIDRKAMPPRDLERARDARKRYFDSERASTGPSARRADTKGGSASPAPIKKGPLHYGPPPPPPRGKYPGIANNPGNVEKHERRSDKTLFKGEIADGVRPKRFANFSDPVDGLTAAATVLSRRAAGLAAKGLPFTIENYVPGYAPSSENDVEGYIDNLSKYSGFARDAVLDTGNAEDMAKLLRNVVRFESGVPNAEWFTDDEYRRAALAMQEGASDR